MSPLCPTGSPFLSYVKKPVPCLYHQRARGQTSSCQLGSSPSWYCHSTNDKSMSCFHGWYFLDGGTKEWNLFLCVESHSLMKLSGDKRAKPVTLCGGLAVRWHNCGTRGWSLCRELEDLASAQIYSLGEIQTRKQFDIKYTVSALNIMVLSRCSGHAPSSRFVQWGISHDTWGFILPSHTILISTTSDSAP